jgi:hypothetical protein
MDSGSGRETEKDDGVFDKDVKMRRNREILLYSGLQNQLDTAIS